MKLYTASFFDPELHGPGRKIGICPSKPLNLADEHGYECDLWHEWLSPQELYWDYHKAKKVAENEEQIKQAGKNFEAAYNNRLTEFKEELESLYLTTKKTIFELIGFEDGDTLLSWERGGNITFRSQTAEFLRSLGYEVEER